MIEAVPWSVLIERFRWAQGEHVAAIAPTGAGKTTLFKEIMPHRRYSIIFGTKKKDRLYDQIIREHGFIRVQNVDEIRPWMDRVLLWPKFRKTIPETLIVQQKTFREALDMVVSQTAWTCWFDESKYMAEMLKLRTELTFCLEQLRSVNATTICGAQRPTWLPLSVLSNATHVFLWKSTFEADAKRLADIGGIDAREIMTVAKTLGAHEFIYIRTRGTQASVVRSQVGR